MDMLKVFDVASPNECFQRSESIVPQQALALANSKLSLTMAREIAATVFACDRVAEPVHRYRRQSAAADACPHRPGVRGVRIRPHPGAPPNQLRLQESSSICASRRRCIADRAKLTLLHRDRTAAVKPSERSRQRARESLVHVLLNHNDFVTIR